MASWNDFEVALPDLAERAVALLHRTGAGEGLLTTLAGEGLPRTHPVNVDVIEGRLLVFVQPASAKARDLATDGRYSLHAYLDPAVPHELLLRGRAVPIKDVELRAAAMRGWAFSPGDDYPLYELTLEHVLFGERGGADAWPPHYTSWRAGRTSSAGVG